MLDSFVDNAELNSSDYDAEDWQKSMLQYERLVEEYSNSGKEYTDAEKQMTARAMGRGLTSSGRPSSLVVTQSI